jgi:hypothetical protein
MYQGVSTHIGFNWFVTWSSSGLLLSWYWAYWVSKSLVIPWPAQRPLSSQLRNNCTELVTKWASLCGSQVLRSAFKSTFFETRLYLLCWMRSFAVNVGDSKQMTEHYLNVVNGLFFSITFNIVTYSGVLFTPKVNTLQLNTVRNS